MRSKRKLLLTAAFTALLGVGAFAGVSLSKETKVVEAAENWWYRGSGKSGWDSGSDSYVLHNVDFDAAGENWSFDADEEFVFTSVKSGWTGDIKYGVSSISGTAYYCFEKTGGDKDNLICLTAGSYNLSLYGGVLYVDFYSNPTFYYAGTDTTKTATKWSDYTAKPLTVNGSAVQMNFKSNEEFKIKMAGDWDHNVLGSGSFKDDDTFYNSFEDSSGNIKCKLTADYTIKVVTDGHYYKIVIKGATDNTIYVLDLYGDLLNNAHNVYAFNSYGNNGWPGTAMAKVAGTTNVYTFAYWEKLTTVIVNQKGDGDKTGQTMNLTPQNGKCLLLRHDVDGEYHWNSNTWVNLEVGKYIDKYMKFETYDESKPGTGLCKSDGWYTAAKNAYEASSFASYRAELCTITYVVERLQAWAAANGGSFDISNSIGSFSAYKNTMILSTKTAGSTIAIIAISATSLAAIGGYFLFRKKKEN